MTELLTTLSILFIIAGAFLLAAHRFRLPTVPILLLSGILVGFFIEEDRTLELAQYGIILLVFTFGTRIELDSARAVLPDSEIVGIGQSIITGGIGFLAGLALGLDPLEAHFIGIATALSSTIVGRGLFEPHVYRNLVHGRLAESIHFVQDLLAILLLLLLGTGTFELTGIVGSLVAGVILVVAGVAINRLAFDRFRRLVKGSDEVLIISTIGLLVVFLAAAEVTGISLAVGAFAAGIAIKRYPGTDIGLVNGLDSITDFFVTIFFVTVGALLAIPSLEILLIALILGILTAIVKPAITMVLLIRRGYEARSATLTGAKLDQVSEFALIIAIEGLVLGLLTQNVFDAIILATAATMITSSITHRYSEELYRALSTRGLLAGGHDQVDRRSNVPEDLSDHVVIVGYGRQGRKLRKTCESLGRQVVVIENDPALLELLAGECSAHVFGDAMERYTWEKAALTDARLVISTVESNPLSTHLLEAIDDIPLILRSGSPRVAIRYFDAGALYVAVPDLIAGERVKDVLGSILNREESIEALREEALTAIEEDLEQTRSWVGTTTPARW